MKTRVFLSILALGMACPLPGITPDARAVSLTELAVSAGKSIITVWPPARNATGAEQASPLQNAATRPDAQPGSPAAPSASSAEIPPLGSPSVSPEALPPSSAPPQEHAPPAERIPVISPPGR